MQKEYPTPRFDYDTSLVVTIEEIRRAFGLWTDQSVDAELERSANVAQRLMQDVLGGPLNDGLWHDVFAGNELIAKGTRLVLSKKPSGAVAVKAVSQLGSGPETVLQADAGHLSDWMGESFWSPSSDLSPRQVMLDDVSQATWHDELNDGLLVGLEVSYMSPVLKTVDDLAKGAVLELAVDVYENNGVATQEAIESSATALRRSAGDFGIARA